MKRREFIAGTGLLLGATCVPSASAATDDSAAVKQVVRDVYPVFYADRNKQKYRSLDRKSTRLNSSHVAISYAVFCLKKKKTQNTQRASTYRNNTSVSAR